MASFFPQQAGVCWTIFNLYKNKFHKISFRSLGSYGDLTQNLTKVSTNFNDNRHPLSEKLDLEKKKRL